VLVLTLTDQRERPLARRSFAPSEYLDDPGASLQYPATQRTALSLPLSVRDVAQWALI